MNTTEQINYELDALDKLSKCGGTIKIKLSETKAPPWNDSGSFGHHYRVTLKTIHGSYSFDFWDSIANRNTGEEPTAYDVLACLTWHNPGEFPDFCSEFGYEIDSIKALSTYRAVVRQWNSLVRIFPAESARELLATIQ